jgi:hypothetical protein
VGRVLSAACDWLTLAAEGALRTARDELDAVTARAVGKHEFDAAVASWSAAREVLSEYWYGELQRALAAGFLPPFVDGLRDFAAARDATVRAEHPDDLALERIADQLLVHSARAASRTATRASWPVVLDVVGRRELVRLVATHQRGLGGVRLANVATVLQERGSSEPGTGPEPQFASALMALVALSMLEAEWVIDDTPRGALLLRRGDELVDPFAVGAGVARGDISRDAFDAWCDASAVAELIDVDGLLADPDGAPTADIPETLLALDALVPDPASAPADEGFAASTVPLSVSRSSRLVALAGLLLVAALAAPLAVLCAGRAATGTDPLRGRLALLACALVFAAALVWVARAAYSTLLTAPSLSVDAAGTLRIEHRQMLREPFIIERGALLAADVDGGDHPARFAVLDGSGPLTPAGPTVRGYLWDATRGARVPVIDAGPGRPNVALVLRHAVAAPRPARGSGLHGTVKGELVDVLLLNARDADQARHVLASLGVLRPITAADIGAAEDGQSR